MRLNIDLGEYDDEPEGLYRAAQLANIACGGHAGDDETMLRALRCCRVFGVAPGVHPSFEDRSNFGRLRLDVDGPTLRRSVRAQCERLRRLAVAEGLALHHAKAHGALYHAANDDAALADAFVRGVVDALGAVVVVGPATGALCGAATAAGVRFLSEVFADRGTLPDGRLVPRGQPGALLDDVVLVVANTRRLLGTAGTICVHGDTPGALDFARAVRAVLDAVA